MPQRAGRNRTIELTEQERTAYSARLLRLNSPARAADILDKTICQDAFEALPLLPDTFASLCFVDPPYNLDKQFEDSKFHRRAREEYATWIESWVSLLPRLLTPDASVYVCSDWRSSLDIQAVLEKFFIIRNRITWEREKGRGAKSNWKNCHEDIWFCTVGKEYHFDVDAVKLKRKVMAPYTDERGVPKDWTLDDGRRFRLTHPSNMWTDISVPFWSMPENTDHPTQKPEKLLARVILASSRPGDTVLDPFAGAGTTSVVAKKLGRRYVGIEKETTYACLAEKRLELAASDTRIQGYTDGVFLERNTPRG